MDKNDEFEDYLRREGVPTVGQDGVAPEQEAAPGNEPDAQAMP